MTRLPDLNALLNSVLAWAAITLATITAIIVVASSSENGIQNPDRFFWFSALLQTHEVGWWQSLPTMRPPHGAFFQLVYGCVGQRFHLLGR